MQNVDSELRRQALECPFLHGDNDMTEELKKLAKIDLNEDEETRARCLEELRCRLREETGLLCQDDDQFLLAFLRARKFSVDRAFSLLKGFYSSTGKYAHVYYNIDRDIMKRTLAQNCHFFLPLRDRDGSTVSIFRMSCWDTKIASPDVLFGVGSLCLLQVLRHNSTQIAGYKIILDYEGFSFKQFSSMRPWHLWLFGEMMQNTFPFRMKGLHILNQNHLFHGIWVVLSKFLSKKLTERVHFHHKNFRELHQFIDPNILPAEYGGGQPSFKDSDVRSVFEASETYNEYVHSFGYEKYLKQLPKRKKWHRNTLKEDETQIRV